MPLTDRLHLAARTIAVLTFGLVPDSVSVPVLAARESAIGLGLVADTPAPE